MNTEHIKNVNLDNASVKNEILEYYHRFKIIPTTYTNVSNTGDMDYIRDGDYIICPQCGGVKSTLMFIKLSGNRYYSVSFPKHNINKRHNIKIFPVDIELYPSLYNGTIMEGIFVRDGNFKIYIINEVFYVGGESQLLKPKIDRLDNIRETLSRSSKMTGISKIYVNKYYRTDADSLEKLSIYVRENSDTIQTIAFYPSTYGKKVYEYTLKDIDFVDNIIKISTLVMEKTSQADVYNLYDNINSKVKIGIAYIPDIGKSKECKSWFREYKKKKLIVKCEMDPVIDKWIPMNVIDTV